MKKIFIIMITLIGLSNNSSALDNTFYNTFDNTFYSTFNNTFTTKFVDGYYRSNGTFVNPYLRSAPDGNPFNNFNW